jgi:pimeloyl-ACP methyl ester carboxylesterase
MPTDRPRPARIARFGRDRFLYAGGHRYHLVEAGRGPPLLMLPGALETYRTWNDVLPRLARRFRCLALDLLGQGDSDAPREARYDVTAQADQMAALLDALEIPRAHLMGAALGGSIVLSFAGRHGERVLRAVAVDGLAQVSPTDRGPLDYLGWMARQPVLGAVAERIGRTGLLALPLVKAQLRGRWRRVGWSDRFQLAADSRVMLRALRRETMAAILDAHHGSRGLSQDARRITRPLLHLAGQRSVYRPLMERTWRVLQDVPAVELIELLGVGSAVQIERPAWCAESVTAFLRAERLPRGRLGARGSDGVRRLRLR